ncbi:MAG: hypothetical protein NTU47_14175 [Ignavibacteriales bacterium]|nr:hypothetical protein [Ignavibacteriales bacterium]
MKLFKLIVLCTALLASPGLMAQPVHRTPAHYTPLPSIVEGAGAEQISLNGAWRFNPSPPSAFWMLKDISLQGWTTIRVPSDWTMQGFTVPPGTPAGYIRSFEVPRSWKDRTIILRCDGIQSEATVWVNGHPAGSHLGGFTPFELDVTPFVKADGSNTLAVSVMNESLADTLASGTQYAAYQFGGISRKVTLFAVPRVYCSSLSINTDLDRRYETAQLEVEFTISNTTAISASGGEVSFAVENGRGNNLLLKQKTLKLPLIGAGGLARQKFSAIIEHPEKWDPEHPRLYFLTMTMSHNNRFVEVVRKRFGIRKIEVVGSQVFVNGSPVKLRGVNRHETHPLLGRSLTNELWRQDAALFREANINYVRTSHYPPAEEFLDQCDELGLFVELESPLCWVGHGANETWSKQNPHSNRFSELILQAVRETIEFNRNHPSILMWSLANESAWGPNWVEAKRLADSLDPTRPKTFHDQAVGQYNNYGSTSMPIANIHYPGPKGSETASAFDRPVLFGEYCHLNTYNRQEVLTDPGVRDNWGIGFARMWEKMYTTRACLGGAIWAGIDDIFYLPGGKTVGYGPWGIIDGWRRPKPEYWHVKKTYSPIRVNNTRLPVPAAGEPLLLQVSNRHDFTNVNELSIVWRIGTDSGHASADIRPHNDGILPVFLNTPPAPGMTLSVDVSSPRGFVIDSYSIAVGDLPSPHVVTRNDETAMKLDTAGQTMTVTGKRFSLVFDKSTGALTSAEFDNRTILVGGPTLMILEQRCNECAPNFSLETKPLNETCTAWKTTSVSVAQHLDTISLIVKGSYAEAEGEYRIHILPNGELDVRYAFACAKDINPRQYGMVFYAPTTFDQIAWKRNAQWSVYPENHIGRPEGSASARRTGGEFRFREAPTGDWRFDRTDLGTADFRSTKSNVVQASLRDSDGNGVGLKSDGTHSVRSFLDGNRVALFVADFNSGGGEIFFAPHHAADDHPLKKGDSVKGAFRLTLIGAHP